MVVDGMIVREMDMVVRSLAIREIYRKIAKYQTVLNQALFVNTIDGSKPHFNRRKISSSVSSNIS